MKISCRLVRVLSLATVLASPAAIADARPGETEIVSRGLSDGAERIALTRDAKGTGHLYRTRGDRRVEVRCNELPGAWGMWLADVDGDKRDEVIVTLRKRARFDPTLENRLHVYALKGDRCVPMWRGTRLAGRFEQIAPAGPLLLALERTGRGRRRIARYRWNGFGYTVVGVLWRGEGAAPPRLMRGFSQ